MASDDNSWQVAVEKGMIVELHSLSRADLNGLRGETLSWDAAKERWGVKLATEDGKSMAVRPANLKRAPPAAPDAAKAAFVAAEQASHILASIRQGHGPPNVLFAKAEALLNQAEANYPAAVVIHQARGDACHMRGQYAEQATHARRAVANGHGLTASDGRNHQNVRRMALAAALGNAGDRGGELEQLRAVLQAEPGHIHARLTLGQSLLERGQFEQAVPELMMAVQLPAEAKPPWPAVSSRMVDSLRGAARQALCTAFGKRAQQLAAGGDHFEAAEILSQRLLTVPGIEPDTEATARANLATSLCAMGKTDEAESVLETARALPRVGALKRAFVLTTSGHLKEQTADAWRGGRAEVDETACALYEAAKAYFREANALAEDAASRQGFTRVQAKVHPDMEWVSAPGAFGTLGGAARALKAGAITLEELPRGPMPRSSPRPAGGSGFDEMVEPVS